MYIDLNLLNSKDIIAISGEYNLDKDYYKNSDIIYLDPIKVDGYISLKEDSTGNFNYYVKAIIKGVMIINDAISLDECNYEYSIDYDDFIPENSKKDKNTLDIFEFLWENILLEVPLKFTKERDLSKFHGDGWRLVSEDELTKNNPFSELLDNLKEE